MGDKAGKRFRTVSLLTVIAVYFLIMVGGVVRSTGAGMGCPDWPKCFGQWVPPTHVSELPANYQEIYAHRGYASTEFNPVKTWIEYGNRLVGVLIGFLIFLTLIFSVPYLKTDKQIFYLSLLSFLLVAFQGWLGAQVVASNLMPVMISVHMVVALVIAGLLLYSMARSQREAFTKVQYNARPVIFALLWLVLLVSLVQIVLGIQVREAIDTIAVQMGASARDLWIENLDISFLIHRSFSLLVLIVNMVLVYRLRQLNDNLLSRFAFWLVVVLVLSILTGVVMAYFSIPPYMQPLHLLLSSVLFGLQFLILLKYYYATRLVNGSLSVA